MEDVLCATSNDFRRNVKSCFLVASEVVGLFTAEHTSPNLYSNFCRLLLDYRRTALRKCVEEEVQLSWSSVLPVPEPQNFENFEFKAIRSFWQAAPSANQSTELFTGNRANSPSELHELPNHRQNRVNPYSNSSRQPIKITTASLNRSFEVTNQMMREEKREKFLRKPV